MAKHVSKTDKSKVARVIKRRRQSSTGEKEVLDEEQRILRAATLHLIQKYGMFLVGTGARPLGIRGLPVWIVTVTLRYAAGHEGYIGDLLYDGREFVFLTEQSLMDERARKIAEDPEGLRQWNEYRATTLLTVLYSS